MPAGKLELYRVAPSEEDLRGQAKPHENSRQLTPEPTLAPVPSVPAVTQVSLEEGQGSHPQGPLDGALVFLLSGGDTTVRPGPGSVAAPVSCPGRDLRKEPLRPASAESSYPPPQEQSTRDALSFACVCIRFLIHSLLAVTLPGETYTAEQESGPGLPQIYNWGMEKTAINQTTMRITLSSVATRSRAVVWGRSGEAFLRRLVLALSFEG